jgi:hypothetical protein
MNNEQQAKLFNEARETLVQKQKTDLAKTGTIRERLTYVFNIYLLTVNQICHKTGLTESDVLNAIFKKKIVEVYVIKTYQNNRVLYHFTSSKELFKLYS